MTASLVMFSGTLNLIMTTLAEIIITHPSTLSGASNPHYGRKINFHISHGEAQFTLFVTRTTRPNNGKTCE